MSFNFAPITSPPLRTPLSSSFGGVSSPPGTGSNNNHQAFGVGASSSSSSSRSPAGFGHYGLQSSQSQTQAQALAQSRSSSSFNSSSVSLSCLSPDGLSVHSLLPNGNDNDMHNGSSTCTIVTRFLPLHQAPDDESESSSSAYTYNDESKSTSSRRSNKFKSNNMTIKSITTVLPTHVQNSFRVDPPLEMICIDNDTTPTASSKTTTVGGSMKNIPLLCIYTKSSAYVIQIQYPLQTADTDGHNVHVDNIRGQVKEIHEPFEAYLTSKGNMSPTICRIKSAPHSYIHNGNLYSTLCKRGAMVMLVTNNNNGDGADGDGSEEGEIILFHGYENVNTNGNADTNQFEGGEDFNTTMEASFSQHHITSPATIHSEQTDMSPIVDFCFMPSASTSASASASASASTNNNSLWNAMTLILSTRNGSLYALSPILFHDTIISKDQVIHAVNYMKKICLQYDPTHTTSTTHLMEYRRARATLQFLNDAFDVETVSSSGTGNNSVGTYAKANIIDLMRKRRSATTWPVTVQPLFIAQESINEYNNGVQCMNVVTPSSGGVGGGGSSTSMMGIVLARNTSMEYILVPSASANGGSGGDHTHILLPRFAYEEGMDAEYFDSLLLDSSILLEQVVFDDDDDNGHEENNEEEQHYQLQNGGGHEHGHGHGCDVVLVSDPMDRNMMHHVSKYGVLTVTTNVISVTQRKLNDMICGKTTTRSQGAKDEETKSNAWTSISMGDTGKKLNGIVISGDAQLGHVLVAILNDGK